MTGPNDLPEPGQPHGPGDIPAERPPALAQLDALAGEWEVEASFDAGYFGPGTDPVTARGARTTFTWLHVRLAGAWHGDAWPGGRHAASFTTSSAYETTQTFLT
jgi:hypothetical protein